jgi:hypothetical protein
MFDLDFHYVFLLFEFRTGYPAISSSILFVLVFLNRFFKSSYNIKVKFRI